MNQSIFHISTSNSIREKKSYQQLTSLEGEGELDLKIEGACHLRDQNATHKSKCTNHERPKLDDF